MALNVYPELVVEIAFDDDPHPADITNIVKTDVSHYVRRVSIRSASRNYQTDRMEAGHATLTMDNRDYVWDQDNQEADWWDSDNDETKLRPGKIIYITAEHSTGTHALFRGHIKSITYENPADGQDSVAVISAVDPTHMLARRTLSALALSEELTGDRVEAVLDHVGWPGTGKSTSEWRSIDAGDVTCAAVTESNDNVLEHLRKVAATEHGTIFFAPDGALTFQERTSRAIASSVPRYVFGEAGGLAHRGFVRRYDSTRIFNDISLRRDATPAVVQETDATSQTRYNVLRMEVSGLLNRAGASGDSEISALGQFLLNRHKEPFIQIPALTLRGRDDEELWEAILTLKVSDRVTLLRGRNGQAEFEDSVFIEGVSHEVGESTRDWQTTFQCSSTARWAFWLVSKEPADANAPMAVLNKTTIVGF